jgi:MFS transporter, OFA family, oxalate/formate antiporter
MHSLILRSAYMLISIHRKEKLNVIMESSKKERIDNPNKGWLVTIAGTGALLALGVLYSWSVIRANIPASWGWAESQKTLPYSVAVVVFSLMTLVGARLLYKLGPRLIVSIGGLLAGLGMIISSFSTSPMVYTLAFGILLGSGIGFVYASGAPTALRWFPPSKAGLISGIVVAGFGMGSVWVAPLSRAMIDWFGLQATMLYLGIGMLIAVVGFAQFLKFPPENYVKPVSSLSEAVVIASQVDYKPRQMAKTWQFYFIWITFAFGSGAGLMVIGNLASIVSDQIGLVAVSAIAVSVLAIGNGAGRIFYGMLSDKIGRRNVLLIAFVFQAAMVLLLRTVVPGSILASIPALLLMVLLIGANFGANMAVFPVITKDYFGSAHFAINYGIVYTAWGLGGFALSLLGSSMKDLFGDFSNAYLFAAGLLIVAAVMMAMLKTPQQSSITPTIQQKLTTRLAGKKSHS